ncbi:DUF3592 domain-containing protein [Mucilaginibacter sp.]|uniref:DUF3592 domain-containing protein n=2 Tax=unclassified Mucilaginibacter TaxID=2617802 RepID=UPI000CBAAE2E|nr:DUF3592 domain-containing protein [Mucilaginibacter sp.]PLW91260.1 MAG: hypothetical protein C0154_02175 [Mucilaginibacter sp.]HEK18849.1 DUF3592 domain-containing protein [Bacteroidota bacterium]
MHINLSDEDFQGLITLLLGCIFLFTGYIYTRRNRMLYDKGIKVEGVVFSIERNDGLRVGNRIEPDYYVTIRYTTTDNLWITKRYDEIRDALTLSEGDKVKVIYNPADPEEFILGDGRSKFGPLVFTLIGVLLIAGSVIAYLFNLKIFS